MRIPNYWSKATLTGQAPSGRPMEAACWGWSDISPEEAQQSARTAAQRALERLVRGEQLRGYGYTDRPLREEVIERFPGPGGNLDIALTRNRYGALVLNAARAMFIDLDFPPVTAREHFSSFFGRLFGRSKPTLESRREQEICDRLDAFVREHRGWSFRVYRTAAGVRALATHDTFDPVADATLNTMLELGADPLYVRMCKAQACFRARLTPKPWRCGHHSNTLAWPRAHGWSEQAFQRWNERYESCQQAYATCRLVGTLGRDLIHPELQTIVQIHDRMTRIEQSLPLA